MYTDSHHGSFGTLAPERAEALMWVWRHRYQELGAREDVQYVLIFENRGVEVGATLHHPHGQIYGYPFLPPVPKLELAADARLGGCAACELLRRELEDGRRIVHENEHVAAYIPYAARWPYETHVVLRRHRPSLLDCEPGELRLLAECLQSAHSRLRRPVCQALPLCDGRPPSAHRRTFRWAPARRVLPAAAYRDQAQVSRWLGAGRGHVRRRHAARGFCRRRCARRSSVSRESVSAFAPGRVNLIGEHTDYNQGLALPFAIAEGVTVHAKATGEERILARALDSGEQDEFAPRRAHERNWLACIRARRRCRAEPSGIPPGGG